ncbi:MAG: hemerythrin family protein [Eubacterium sp.]|nr:hemerythrin family protein [Eubacterium sp.]
MKAIEWNDRFSIGVEIVDHAHQKLFSIVRKLNRLSENSRKNEWTCMEGIKYFKNYAMTHFTQEEAYMRSVGYGRYEMHKRLHDNMVNHTLPVFEMELVKSGYSEDVLAQFLNFCSGWLTEHILIEDRAITGKVSSKWVHEQSEEELIGFSQAVTGVLEQEFRLDAMLASRYYSSEDIGNAYYYRFLYRTKDGRKQQVFLAFEEQLLLYMAGRIQKERFMKMEKRVLDSIGMLSSRIVKGIGERFAQIDPYQAEKDNMLTYDQFIKVFEREYPYYSMLFRTNRGFFAVCAVK